MLIDKVDKVVNEHFNDPLHKFTESMASVRAYAVPHPIDVSWSSYPVQMSVNVYHLQIKQTFFGNVRDIHSVARQHPEFIRK